MACEHNLAKINQLKQEINNLQHDIINLRNNITKSTDIKQKHSEFNSKLQCVMTNLSGNYVEAGKTYDSGKMLKCSVDAMKTISDCDTIISESNKQVTINENTIRILERQIASLQGDCSSCAAAKAAEANSQKNSI